jgi:uncharacterized protein
VYLDASAAMKLVTIERETPALRDFLLRHGAMYSSWLLAAEVRRATWILSSDAGTASEAEAVLARTTLVDIDRHILRAAGQLAPDRLRTLDAIHLATAIDLGEEIDLMLVYDRRLAEGARRHGIAIGAPGTEV